MNFSSDLCAVAPGGSFVPLAEDQSLSSMRAMPWDVRLDDLTFGEGVRGGGLDEDHVALLVESAGAWPPIVVWGDKNQVVDGHHRVAAARRLGRSHLPAVRLVGSPEDAYVESV